MKMIKNSGQKFSQLCLWIASTTLFDYLPNLDVSEGNKKLQKIDMRAFSYPHGSEQSSHRSRNLSCFQTGKDSGWATTTTGVGVGYSMNGKSLLLDSIMRIFMKIQFIIEPVLAREEVALDTSRDSSHKSKASNGAHLFGLNKNHIP